MAQPPTQYLPPIRPSAAIRARYEAKLDEWVKAMHKATQREILAAYKANAPEIAADASPARTLAAALRKLRSAWMRRFADLAPVLAKHFVSGAGTHMDNGIKTAMRNAGFTVKFTTTPAINDILQAGIAENVSLIKSIPAQYFTQIEGSVMRSVQAGRDLGALTDDLMANYGVTRRRAAFIARDQNNKASTMRERARRLELLGEDAEAEWRHTGSARVPRPKHVEATGRRFYVRQGCLIDGEYIQPGEKPNCGCTSKLIIPGLLTKAS